MTAYCMLFGAMYLKKEEIGGKRVIEVGSYNVNGSLRPLFESYNPAEYIGVDISPGPGVDQICDVNDLITTFASQSFDVVVSTELLEHVKDWRNAIHNIKAICKPGGKILVTTRSIGFSYHGHPFDFWRYEIEDMQYIFQDLIIEKLEKDPQIGVLMKAVKPSDFLEQDLSGYALYSIVSNKRTKELTAGPINTRVRRLLSKQRLREFLCKLL